MRKRPSVWRSSRSCPGRPHPRQLATTIWASMSANNTNAAPQHEAASKPIHIENARRQTLAKRDNKASSALVRGLAPRRRPRGLAVTHLKRCEEKPCLEQARTTPCTTRCPTHKVCAHISFWCPRGSRAANGTECSAHRRTPSHNESSSPHAAMPGGAPR